MIQLGSIIKSRLRIMGMTRNTFADYVGTSYTQLNKFFDNRGPLSIDATNKCFEVLNIRIDVYENRAKLAEEVARILHKLGKTVNDVLNMEQTEMANLTKIKSINDFFEIKDDDYDLFKKIANSEFVDIEATYIYFRGMVAYCMQIKDGEFTSPNARNAIYELISLQKREITNNSNNQSLDKKIEKMAPEKDITLPKYEKGQKPKQDGAKDLFNTDGVISIFLAVALSVVFSAFSSKKIKF